jgi:hypothetical protein
MQTARTAELSSAPTLVLAARRLEQVVGVEKFPSPSGPLCGPLALENFTLNSAVIPLTQLHYWCSDVLHKGYFNAVQYSYVQDGAIKDKHFNS